MERAGKQRSIILAIGILLLASGPSAFALNPSLDVNQYAHTAWKLSEGISKGNIWSIAQTPDGYLWLGTEFGLLRFDGVRAVPWQPPAGEHLPSSDVTSVRVTRDGALWIGTSGGLVSWKGDNLTHYEAFNGLIIEALLEDREGTVWVIAGRALPESRLCSVQKEKTHCYGEDGGAGSGITSMYEDSRGVLWAGGMKGIWRWNPGPPQFYPMAGPEERTYALTESDDGGILISRASGITKLRNGKFERYPLPVGLRFPPSKLLRDRDGGLWIGALVDQGLLHIHQGKTDLFTSSEGVFGDLSGHQVRCFFEDREGNIWVSTPSGLDRFREFAIPTVSVPQGLSSRGISSILAGKDGSIWLATSDGLNRWNGGRVDVYRNRSGPLSSTLGRFTTGQFAEPGTTTHEIVDAGFPPQEVTSLFEDQAGRIWVSTLGGVAFLESNRFIPVRSVPPGNVFSIIGDRAEQVWMSHEEGLFHLQQGRLVERTSWAKLGQKEPASALLHDPLQGGLWLGFHDGGVKFLKDGQLRASYAGPQGLAEGIVHSFYKDGSGVIWTATEGGLSRIENSRVLTLTSQNGLPCNNVHWMKEDDAGSVWLYTACGLVRMPRSELDAWVSGSKHVTQLTVFDLSDGVGIHPNISRESPVVAKARDGRLWFITLGGVSIIDPHHLAFNKLPPPVHIERITADGKTYGPTEGERLPALVRDLTIDYTALSLVVPEKVHFKYKLEGQDKDWREVVNDREVQYSNLPPRHYRFRVIASNNSGVWNEEGATLDFTIPPAWYQTNWFRALCVAAFMALLWGLYRLRVQQMEEQEKKFREAVETMPALAFVAEPNGKRTFVNQGWLEYTGFNPERASGFGWEEAIHPDDLKRVLERWRAAEQTGQPLEYEARIRRGSDAAYRWFQTRARPLSDKRGRIIKWCAVATDIEDRKRAEQLQSDLAHINRVSLMGEMAASLAHDIKQPIAAAITSASSCLQWLAHDPPNVDKARAAATRIEKDGSRAASIIDRLRALYKKAPPQRELLVVNDVIGEMAVLLRGEANRYGVSIRTDLAAQLPTVMADRVQIQQVLMNLMLNGIEAMNETGGVLTVKSQLGQDPQVLISVSDTGVGLPVENADQIFEAFFTTKAQGSGMGLAISRSIVESHGGRLWASANDGRGATFLFILPVAAETRQAVAAGTQAESSQPAL